MPQATPGLPGTLILLDAGVCRVEYPEIEVAEFKMSRKTDNVLVDRDANCLANATSKDWKNWAGKVLAIDPVTETILGVFKNETELNSSDLADRQLELFHVPARQSLRSV